jgi:molybdenum cofactor guanylyltransferase
VSEPRAATARFSAIVLAGGRGSRLGGIDKPALELDGVSLVARAVAAARDAGASPVVVVGPERAGLEVLWAREDPPFGGPVAALAAGLARLGIQAEEHPPRNDDEFVLLVAADQVRPEAVVSELVMAARDADGVLLEDEDGHPQWLCGLYRRAALTAALGTLGDPAGASMGRLLRELRLAKHPISNAVIADIDTPADAERHGITLGAITPPPPRLR